MLVEKGLKKIKCTIFAFLVFKHCLIRHVRSDKVIIAHGLVWLFLTKVLVRTTNYDFPKINKIGLKPSRRVVVGGILHFNILNHIFFKYSILKFSQTVSKTTKCPTCEMINYQSQSVNRINI